MYLVKFMITLLNLKKTTEIEGELYFIKTIFTEIMR